MSLTRSFLRSINCTEEQIPAIIDAHMETVDPIKSDRDKYRDEAEKLAKTQKELEAVKTELEALKKDGGNWQKLYEDTKSEFETFKTDLSAKEELKAKKSAYKELLKEAGVIESKHDRFADIADLSKAELVDGKFKDPEKILESIKADWNDFIVETKTKGTSTHKASSNSGTKMTKEEIMKIKDAGARQKAIEENHELFGF